MASNARRGARIALPPGAVVSRLTLWIDGEEREAAFGGRSQVRQAYESVVRRRRDPVLVGTCGPDRIQMQCYPVPPDGGEMKVRIGFTVPLVVADDGASGRLDAPAIIERNFHMPRATLELPETQILPLDPPLAEACWARDSRADPPAIVRQTATLGPAWRPERVAVVVDDSRSMRQAIASASAALAELPDGIEVRLWTAGDTLRPAPPIVFAAPADEAARKRLARALDPDACQGGRCNLRALQAAWDDLAGDPRPAALVWVHGPQPYPLASADSLGRRLERSTRDIRFYAVQVVPGTCRISEALDGVRGIRTLAPNEALADAGAPLRRLAGSWVEGASEWQIVRSRAEEADVAGMREAGEHLVRQWTVEEVRRRLVSGDAVQREEARRLALAWHLVTPVSSAVVLETQQQYQEAGLEPVEASSVPTVPEPSFWISILLALAVLAAWRLRERRTSRGA
ncbi:MAG: VIT domain-containing protein [Kiritimatiellia bacterium]